MPSDSAIRVVGLREVQEHLKKFGDEAPKQLRLVNKSAAEIVAAEARSRAPRQTGKLAASIKALATQRGARVKAGSAKVPYFKWIDFGGTIRFKRRPGEIRRPFLRDGRILYPAVRAKRNQVVAMYERAIADLCRSF